MEKETVDEIIACLPQGRTLFYYHKDRYALQLLHWAVQHASVAINELRHSPYARLLEKPLVRRLLAGSGNGLLSREQLINCWESPFEIFALTLSSWGGYQRWRNQTSRAGHNLVLQLNFSHQHDDHYRKLVKPTRDDTFSWTCHPIFERRKESYFRQTLAWVRIDLDFHDNVALIEEIQSDWISEAHWMLKKRLRSALSEEDRPFIYGVGGTIKDLRRYLVEILDNYARLWDEAMLTAALWFIREELGIRRIYYHTFDTGVTLKSILWGRQPPRSLYTELPRRFCFETCKEPPDFIARDKQAQKTLRKIKSPEWFFLHV